MSKCKVCKDDCSRIGVNIHGHCAHCAGHYMRELEAELAHKDRVIEAAWQPIETAPRGSGVDGPVNVRHPDYIKPPTLLLYDAVSDEMHTGYYDWYYHDGYGYGADERDTAWVGEEGACLYPTHWLPLPTPPKSKAKEVE